MERAAESSSVAGIVLTMMDVPTIMEHWLQDNDTADTRPPQDSAAIDEYSNSTDNFLLTYLPDNEVRSINSLRLVLRRVVIPVIAVVGMLANTLNIVVLTRMNKHKSLPIYSILIAMTTADIMVTACNFLESTLFYIRPDPILFTKDIGKLGNVESVIYSALRPASNVFGFISNWCTVAMATFRFMAVYHYMKASFWCTQRSAMVIIASSVAVSVLITVPPSVLGAFQSTLKVELPFPHSGFCVLYATASDVLPWVLCVILASMLLVSLRKNSWNNMESKLQSRRHNASDKNRQLTATLTLTATWFVLTTAPSTATMIISFWNFRVLISSPELVRLHILSKTLVLLNFNSNFFFYSWINKRHRKELTRLFRMIIPSQK